MVQTKLSISYKPVNSLHPDPRNSRVHSKKQIRQLARSIGTFDFLVPVLTDAQGRIIAGHGRVLAAQHLGIAEIPTISVEHLSDSQIAAFMIADNRLTENAEWDRKLLAEQFKSLLEVDLPFSVDITGFEVSEIDLMIEDIGNEKLDAADVIPASVGPTITRPGDLWILGRHQVYCGDSTTASSYEFMNGARANVVFTDPPYNDPIDGYVNGFGKQHHREFAMASGELTSAEFERWLANVLSHLAARSTNGALQFICMDWRHAGELLAAARDAYTDFKNVCVWVKETAGQGSLYRSQHELIFVFKNGKKPHRNNIQLGKFGRYRTNVWNYKRVNTVTGNSEDKDLTAIHPTIKPVQLVVDAILDCTARGDSVLDPFSGSGTTLIASERTGRRCYGIELDPRYVDTIIRRWQKFTGSQAVHKQTGRTFNAREEEMADA